MLRELILQSCHATLIRLGDLSRYRETELQTKTRNWGPAIGYYDLATEMKPTSGASHNQLAVIALADENHLRAVYQLYRAVAIDEPHAAAKGNLGLEFKKILDRWQKQKLIPPEEARMPGVALQVWFLCFHAKCFQGVEFKEHGDLENEILGQLAVELKERSVDSMLNKMTLINIAAEYVASVSIREDGSCNPLDLAIINADLNWQRRKLVTLSTVGSFSSSLM